MKAATEAAPSKARRVSGEAAMGSPAEAGVAFSFNDFSEEVFFNCLVHLEGGREVASLAPVSKVWAQIVAPGSGPLWKTFGAQEFGRSNLQAPPAPKDKTSIVADFTGVDRYASLARAASLREALWGRVQTQGFGSREGTPWLFLGRSGEEIFAFGGYDSHGPANDVKVASLTGLKEVLAFSSAGTASSAVASSAKTLPGPAAGAGPDDADDAPTDSLPPAPATAEGCAAAEEPARIESRLDFVHVAVRGMPPQRSYGATLTPLVDDEVPNCDWFDIDIVRGCLRDPSVVPMLPGKAAADQTTLFVVTGGYMSGGYRNESPDWSLGIAFPRPAGGAAADGTSPEAPGRRFSPPERVAGHAGQAAPQVEVLWVKPGPATLDAEKPNRPTPRSNAAAVYVPSRFADPAMYPKGYVMLYGGNANGRATSSMDVLDLATFEWRQLGVFPGAPCPRNSHSVVLMPDDEEPSSKAKVLVFGGGTGTNVPREGKDLEDFAVFDPRAMAWLGPPVVPGAEPEVGRPSRPLVPGRAHVAVKIGRSVLFFGGGHNPTNQLSAVLCRRLSERHAQRLCEADGEKGDADVWETMLRSLKWRSVPPRGDSGPTPRSFHAAVSLAPAGVPVLLTYGGWHPRRGNFGDIWAAKLDPCGADGAASAVRVRALEADRRFSHWLSGAGPSRSEDEEDDDDEMEGLGPLVNVSGHIMPLQGFAQFLRARFGELEGARRLEELLTQSRAAGGGGGDQDELEEEDEDTDPDPESGDSEPELPQETYL